MCANAGGTTYKYVNVLVPTQTAQTQASLSQSAASTGVNQPFTIAWGLINATACTVSYTGPDDDGTLSNGPASGSMTITAGVAGTYIATNSCTGPGGSVNSPSITHIVTATTALTGSRAALTASVANAFPDVHKVAIIPGQFSHAWLTNLQFGTAAKEDVAALQAALTQEGVFTGEATGTFLEKTLQSVKEFQAKYGIEQTGYVGPQTRDKLNHLY